MNTERAKTAIFVVAALVLIAFAAWVEPEAASPEIFSDQGEPLFPLFRDVLAVRAIEVVDYNEDDATAEPLKLEFRDGRWLLPSHSDYPAEAGDRLAKTAGALLDLKKDLVVSDRIEDHATYGVIDPLDPEAASLTGRGKRVTLRDEHGEILAEMVLGMPMSDHPGYRYVRLPSQNRVYGVKTDADPSAQFADWVEANFLRLSADTMRRVTLNSYSIDETFGRITDSQLITLTKGDDGKWTSAGDRRPAAATVDAAVAALTGLRPVAARPKPPSLAERLRRGEGLEMTFDAVIALRERGYFVTGDGRIYSNEGELQVETANGLVYTLRFGEIYTGRTNASPADGEEASADSSEQDRFVWVTVAARGDEGATAARDLTRRFAGWFYVISGDDFRKLTLRNS